MKLRNKEAFGNFKPGDEVEVPDGSVYDTYHWDEVKDEVRPTDDKKKGDK
jgi:hypothetical protein